MNMENYCITTDSNSDLPSDLAQKYQTVIIPQYYAFGDDEMCIRDRRLAVGTA